MKDKLLYTKKGAWLFLITFILIFSSGCNEQASNQVIPATNLQSFDIGQEETLYNNEEMDSIELTREESIDLTIEIQSILYGDEAIVGYDSELIAITIMPTDVRIVPEIEAMITGRIPRDDWNYIVEQIRLKSIAVADTIDYDTAVLFLNPITPERALIAAHNGEVLYNAVDEGRY